jgi:hypothetical protein
LIRTSLLALNRVPRRADCMMFNYADGNRHRDGWHEIWIHSEAGDCRRRRSNERWIFSAARSMAAALAD